MDLTALFGCDIHGNTSKLAGLHNKEDKTECWEYKIMSEYVVRVDLGGTKVEACLLDSQRNLLNRYREATEADRGMKHVSAKIILLSKQN